MNTEHLFETGLTLVLVVIGAVVWFIRLEGRVNLLDRVLMDHLEAKKELMADLTAHMHRIEQKVDRIALRCAAFSHLHQLDVDERERGNE